MGDYLYCYEDLLIPEILENIFLYLDFDSLKNTRIVCWLWKNVSESVWWKMVNLNVCIENVLNVEVKNLLSNSARSIRIYKNRWHHVDPLYLNQNFTNIFNEISNSSSIKEVYIDSINFRFKDDLVDYDYYKLVSPTLLGEAISKLEKVKIDWCSFDCEQITTIFKRISTSTNLKEMEMESIPLNKIIPPQIIISAVKKINIISFNLCKLSPKQLTYFYQEISTGNTSIRNLKLINNNQKDIEAKLFASALIKLESLEIINCHLSLEQLKCLFTEIGKGENVKLKYLTLSSEDNLKNVPQDIIDSSISKLKSADIEITNHNPLRMFLFR